MKKTNLTTILIKGTKELDYCNYELNRTLKIIDFKIEKFNERKLEKQKHINDLINDMIKDEIYYNEEITELRKIFQKEQEKNENIK